MPTPNDEQLYLDATQEVDNGTPDPALWAKAMALAEGDEEKARYRYIALRVEQGSSTSEKTPRSPSSDRKPLASSPTGKSTSAPVSDRKKCPKCKSWIDKGATK